MIQPMRQPRISMLLLFAMQGFRIVSYRSLPCCSSDYCTQSISTTSFSAFRFSEFDSSGICLDNRKTSSNLATRFSTPCKCAIIPPLHPHQSSPLPLITAFKPSSNASSPVSGFLRLASEMNHMGSSRRYRSRMS